MYSPFLFLSSLFPLACHVVAKSGLGMSLGRSYTWANPSNSHWCTCPHGRISSSPIALGHLNPHKTMLAVGSCRRALGENTLPFAFVKHSFITCRLIPAVRQGSVGFRYQVEDAVYLRYHSLPSPARQPFMPSSMTVSILSSFQMRMAASLLVPPPRCAWEEPGGGPQPYWCPSHLCKHGSAGLHRGSLHLLLCICGWAQTQ